MWDRLYINTAIATMDKARSGDYGLIFDGGLAIEDNKIAWVGEMGELKDEFKTLAVETQDLEKRLLTPGLIDCHTHLVFAGERSNEFEARLNGASYDEISKAGGGIRSTVSATRNASEEELLHLALDRIDQCIANGVTTIEIKSGYGLDTPTELKMLRVAKTIEDHRSIRVQKTFLGAHALPPEFDGDADAYIHFLCEEMLPAAHSEGLVDAVDGFCEQIGFTKSQIEKVFKKATALGLPIKLHAEQLSDMGGAALAAKYSALSADHLEYLTPEDVKSLAKAGTVAVLLPGAFYYLNETKLPPVSSLRKEDVEIAVATDFNPGTSPMLSLQLAMNMACTYFGLTVEEALTGITRNAAKALGLDKTGSIKAGNIADLTIWDVKSPAQLVAPIAINPLYQRIFDGKLSS